MYWNIVQVSRFETSQKKNYRENSTMTKFRMTPEPDLTHAIYMKVRVRFLDVWGFFIHVYCKNAFRASLYSSSCK
jgi:hypothetical protein